MIFGDFLEEKCVLWTRNCSNFKPYFVCLLQGTCIGHGHEGSRRLYLQEITRGSICTEYKLVMGITQCKYEYNVFRPCICVKFITLFIVQKMNIFLFVWQYKCKHKYSLKIVLCVHFNACLRAKKADLLCNLLHRYLKKITFFF